MNGKATSRNGRDPEAIFGEARWMWPDGYCWDLHNTFALFRTTFHLEQVPESAQLYLTADQSYQLYLNGIYVCRGPARGFQSHWPYDEVDVRSWLRPGRNTIALRAYNPGFSNFQYLCQGYAGVLLAAQWGDLKILSGGDWKSRRQSGVNPAAIPSCLQMFPQEHIDLREEDPAWMQPDFDDSDWQAPTATQRWNAMPWDRLEERGIPLLEEELIGPPKLIGQSAGNCLAGYEKTRDVARLRITEGLDHAPAETRGARLSVAASGRGHYRSYLLDFGRTVVGSLGLEIQGAHGGEIIDTLHGERIDSATLRLNLAPDLGSRMAFGSRIICRPGEQSHFFHHPYGFRYIVVTVRDAAQDLMIRPCLRSTMYPLDRKAHFETSDTVLQRIWEACAWTQRVCSLDAYVDTPGREQVQWWGDARVQAKNTFFYNGDTKLFRRGIAQIAAQRAPSGLTYGHAPTMAHTCILPDFTLVWIITLWDYYWQTGSLEPLQAHEETIQSALAYFAGQTDSETGLLGYDDRYWLFLDWCEIFKTGYSTVYNLWYLLALEKLAALDRAAGRATEAENLSARAGLLRRALHRLIRKDGLICDGLTYGGDIVPDTSIHAQTLAILARLDPAGDPARLEKVLLPFIRKEVTSAISPSCYWITYVFEVLTEAGHGEAVIDYIRERWEPMAAYGTTWEVFEPREGEESFSHAWSAHPLHHLMQTLGGIRQAAPRWDEVIYQPSFRGDYGDIGLPTPHGEIRSKWKRAGHVIAAELSLPDGVRARVHLPDQEPTEARGETNFLVPLRPAHPERFVDENKILVG